ncbi:hypothetical protein [Mesorhizobium sp. B263B2A]|uniref:hypothetical protein n=1 Tax=Mesorhizobium sp. B263B2A TaxID=2876669 RepID=UPI001CD127DB|nr:hypothetical protein [Mesorhizobium sp. B263B2A]MCA0034336.1 hypothetical protein [Mesorhizobium sp. B263B2A]
MAKATRTTAGASSSKPKNGATTRHTRKLSVEGVVLHVRAIVEQGRTQEFLDACKQQGFTTMKGPPGLVAFARNFVSSPSVGATKDGGGAKVVSAVKAMVAAKAVNPAQFDVCDC